MADTPTTEPSLDDFVTAAASFSIAADTEALPGQRKLGKMYPPGRYIGGEFRMGDGHTYSIVCDEPPFLEGEGTAPQPLQYFLAGIAF
jgi:hypothetical protein